MCGARLACAVSALTEGPSAGSAQGYSFEEDKRRVMKFMKGWSKHDWTVQLDGGEY